METAPQIPIEVPARVPYARRTAPLGRARRGWWIAAAVVGLAVFGTAFALRLPRLVERLFGRATADPTVYVVKPVDLSITLSEDGELKPKNSISVKCELEGQSTILSIVDESKQVKKGDLLVELASDAIKDRLDSETIELSKIESALRAAQKDLELTRSENESKIEKARVAVEIAELELKRYDEGEFVKALQTAEMNVKQSQMEIERKEDDLRKKRELKDKGFAQQSELDQLKFELDKAKMTLALNELAKTILLAYEKPKNMTQRESDVRQAQQELEREQKRAADREEQARDKVKAQEELLATRKPRVARLREQYEKCRIYAPLDGIVQYPSEEGMFRMGGMRIAAGEKVFEGQTLIVLPDTSQMVVTTRIHEADRHQVGEGLRCLVKIPAVPGRAFTGTISRIAQFADSTNRWLNPELKEHATEILLDETDAPVSPGDSAEIKILVGEVSNVLAVPVQCVFARGPKSYVFVRRNGKTEYTEVKLGRSDSSMVEVAGGLSAGDAALMHVDEELLATLPAAAAPQTTMRELPPLAPIAGGPPQPSPGGPPQPPDGHRVVLRAGSDAAQPAATQPVGPAPQVTIQPATTQPKGGG